MLNLAHTSKSLYLFQSVQLDDLLHILPDTAKPDDDDGAHLGHVDHCGAKAVNKKLLSF